MRAPRHKLLVIATSAILAATPIALIVFAVITAIGDGHDRNPMATSDAYLLAAADAPAGLAALSPQIAAARRVSSVDELLALSGAVPAVVMIDPHFAQTLAPESLRGLAAAGYALIGLDVPIDRLATLAGYKQALDAIDPIFSDANTQPATFSGPFFTIEWRSPPGQRPALGSQSQHELTPALVARIVADYELLVRGLIAAPSGAVVPLSEWAENRALPSP